MFLGHTKFQSDSIFSYILNTFYKTHVFGPTDLLNVFISCDKNLVHVQPLQLQRWREPLNAKYPDVPKITEGSHILISHMHLRFGSSTNITDIVFRVKRKETRWVLNILFKAGVYFSVFLRLVMICPQMLLIQRLHHSICCSKQNYDHKRQCWEAANPSWNIRVVHPIRLLGHRANKCTLPVEYQS